MFLASTCVAPGSARLVGALRAYGMGAEYTAYEAKFNPTLRPSCAAGALFRSWNTSVSLIWKNVAELHAKPGPEPVGTGILVTRLQLPSFFPNQVGDGVGWQS